ncbi:MAG: ribonuclease III [Legionellaceae bacterium]|nr:ribonuclease III [Legionellaceae bacterium]
MSEINLSTLTKKIGYQFVSEKYAVLALSHRSVGDHNNERLEFLGDALLNFVIAATLFEKFPEAREGRLSRLRATLVQRDALAKLSKKMMLGDFLILGAGEMKTGGSQRSSILADAFEALIGAIYLDGGMEACKERILFFYEDLLSELTLEANYKDPKTCLQEFLQSKKLALPTYELLGTSGEEHSQVFIVRCSCALSPDGKEGRGTSRRKAEQAAAKALLEAIRREKK